MPNIVKRSSRELATNGNDKPNYKRQADWIVADISGSMATHLPTNTRLRRIDCLNQAINSLVDDVQIIAFSSSVEYPPRVGKVAFEPRFDTLLAPALAEVAKYEPSYIVIMTDGQVQDDHEKSFALAREIARTAVIDTLYIGPDDPQAMAFLEKLAEIGHGRAKQYDLSAVGELVALDREMQRLLPAPEGTIEI